MARAKTNAPLDVLVNGRLVGRLSKEPSGAIATYDATKMTVRALASWYNMRKKLAYAVQASASYRLGWKQTRTSAIGRFKAAIQDAAKPEGNSTVGELDKFWAGTQGQIAIRLIF